MTENVDPVAVPDYRALGELTGRSVVVLGAGAGIGRQSAHAVAQFGAQVVCVDRDEELAKAVATEIGGIPLAGDITRRADLERVIADAEAQAGPLTGLVDVVGVARPGPFAGYDDDAWAAQFDIVFGHARLAMQIGGAALARAGGGAMVFVGSQSGSVVAQDQTPYGVAKAALHHLVRSVGVEWGPRGIRVNAVAPGPTRTPRLTAVVDEQGWQAVGRLVPRGYAGLPSEIASVVQFLLSDLSSYVTGHVLVADGGQSLALRGPEVRFFNPGS